jgi:Lytic transglycolase
MRIGRSIRGGESVLVGAVAPLGASPSAHPVGESPTIMHVAFSKHALLGNLRSVGPWAGLLGVLATLAAPTVSASAATGGGTSTAITTSTPTTSPSTPSTPSTAATTPASGSTSGGAAPAPTAGRPTLATWFGPGFYGHATACGQRLTPQLVGVANRTLPCGTLVQIGYRGHELTVPVLDRGPYGHNGAAWDLTSGAARALEIKDTVRITTQVVGSLPNSPTLGEPPTSSPLAAGTSSAPLSAPEAAATGGAAAG